MEHLVALGHQQIALLAGPLSSVSARLRLAGWHKYLTRNQIQPIAEREGDWSAMSGFQQTMQLSLIHIYISYAVGCALWRWDLSHYLV